MSYETFVSRVTALVEKVGGIKAGFEHDTEKGRYIARCSDGTTIIGNPSMLKVTVKWANHTALATI